MKPYLLIMCGISASGKSTIANRLHRTLGTVIVSTDAIREELGDVQDQSQNSRVFDIFHARIRENLLNRKDVIADATNITAKSRKQILEVIKDIDCDIDIYVMTKPIHKCIEDNNKRTRKVPEEVIIKQHMKYEMPLYREGFNRIITIDYMEEK